MNRSGFVPRWRENFRFVRINLKPVISRSSDVLVRGCGAIRRVIAHPLSSLTASSHLRKRILGSQPAHSTALTLAVLILFSCDMVAAPIGAEITYQGRLTDGGAATTG